MMGQNPLTLFFPQLPPVFPEQLSAQQRNVLRLSDLQVTHLRQCSTIWRCAGTGSAGAMTRPTEELDTRTSCK